jgi:hypothetical protein
MKAIKTKAIKLALAGVVMVGLSNSVFAQSTLSGISGLSLGGLTGISPLGGTQQQYAMPTLAVPQYDPTALQAQGCDPNVMNQLLNNWVMNSARANAMQNFMMQQNALAAPKPPTGSNGSSCYQNAVNNIENAMGPFAKILSLFSGGAPDMNAIGSAIGATLGNVACSMVSSYTSSLAGGLTSSLNSTQLGGGYSIGSVGGIVNSTVTSSGTINSTGVANTVTNTAMPYINSGTSSVTSSLNPFK